MKRLLCWLLGHDWRPWRVWPDGLHEEEWMRCRRCLEVDEEEPSTLPCDHLLLPGNGTCIRCGR